jgi:hypothetical protein
MPQSFRRKLRRFCVGSTRESSTVLRFAFVSVLTFGVLGSVFFLSSARAEMNVAAETPSKAEALFR